MRLFGVLLFVTLAFLGRAQEEITCRVTHVIDTSNRARMPYAHVQMRVPGTFVTSGQIETDGNHHFKTAFFLYNASNGVQLHTRETSYSIATELGVSYVSWTLDHFAYLVGPVNIKYDRLPFQVVNLFFNGTRIDSLDLTCPVTNLNAIYHGVITGGKVTMFTVKPAKRCDSNTTSAFPASWLTYVSHTCDSGVPGCTYFNRGSLCATGSDLLPVDSSRMQWYCTASANFSTDLLRLDYTVTSGLLCDAADNHTITHKSGTFTTDSNNLRVYYGLQTGQQNVVILPNEESLHDVAYVDVNYPVVFANFTQAKQYLAITHSSGLGMERCLPTRLITQSIIEFACADSFRPLPRETVSWVLVGNKYHYIFHGGHGVETTYANDDELDSGDTAVITTVNRITGVYRLSANQVLFRATHTVRDLPDADNLKFYESAVYNVSNVTRATATSFYANLNTANALPDSDHLKAYSFPIRPHSSTESMFYSTALTVTNGAPDDSVDVGIDDLTGAAKVGVYIALVAAGVLGLLILYKASMYCHPPGKGYNRVGQ